MRAEGEFSQIIVTLRRQTNAYLQSEHVSQHFLKCGLLDLVVKELLARLQHEFVVVRRLVEPVAQLGEVGLDRRPYRGGIRLERIIAAVRHLLREVLEKMQPGVE